MTQEQGTIVEVEKNVAHVRIGEGVRASRCAGCGRCTAQADGSLMLDVPISAPQREHITAGQKVTVQMDTPRPYRAMLLLFVLPIVGLIAGAELGQPLQRAAYRIGLAWHWLSGATAFVAGALALAIGILIEHHSAARRRPPRLIAGP